MRGPARWGERPTKAYLRKVANRHPCAGGCGTIVSGERKWCCACGVTAGRERLNALKRRRRRERLASVGAVG